MDSLVSRYQRKTSHLHRQLTCAWLPNLLAPLYWTFNPLHTRAVFFHAAALCDTLNNPLAAAAAAMRSTAAKAYAQTASTANAAQPPLQIIVASQPVS